MKNSIYDLSERKPLKKSDIMDIRDHHTISFYDMSISEIKKKQTDDHFKYAKKIINNWACWKRYCSLFYFKNNNKKK